MKELLLASCAVGAFGLFSGAASAATATAAAAATDTSQSSTVVGDIVVTAEHHEQRLQRVPVAISVFTGAQRDTIGINTVQEVTNFAPGFAYDPATVHAYIRGVGRQSVNVTDDQRVSTYEDEFYVYSPYGLDKSSLFLQREQIERGPQNVGGRNAAAGSIDMISVRPTDHPYAEVRATVGNFGTYDIEGAVSGQVAPGLTVRLSAYDHNQNQGYYRNLAGGPSEGNEIHEWYVEGQAEWKPNDKFELWTRVFLSGWNNRGDAGSRVGYVNGSWDETALTDGNAYVGGGLFVNPNFGYAGVPGSPPNAALAAAQLAGDQDPTPIAVQFFNNNILNNPAATNPNNFAAPLPRSVKLNDYDNLNYIATYHFNTFDFKYSGGVQGYNYHLDYNGTDTNVRSFTLPGSAFTSFGGLTPAQTLAALSAFPGCTGCGLDATGAVVDLPAATTLPSPSTLVINPLIHANYEEDDWWTAHDFTFQSTTNDPFQWTLGAFYFRQHYNQPYEVRDEQQPQLAHPFYAPPSPIFLDASNPATLVGFTPPSFPAAANPRNDFLYLDYKFDVESIAGYGEASYKFGDQWRVTGNLRYSTDRKWGTETARYLFFGSAIIDGLSPFFGNSTPALDVTPSQTCFTGNPSSCDSGPLAKGVASLGTILPNGNAFRRLADTSSAVTGGAGIEWTPTSDVFLYARYGRGYESMSFNAGQILANPEVSPEFLNSYEVGYKQSFGHNLSIDVAAFYYDYEGLQLPISIINGGVTQSAFINIPKSESTGVEFEGYWNPTPSLSLVLTYSYDYTSILTRCTGKTVGAAFVPDPNALCVIDGQDPGAIAPGARPIGGAGGTFVQDVRGDALPNAPRNKVALDVAYTWNFAPGSFTLSGAYVWRDTMDGTIFNRFYDNSPSWSDVDFRALWKGRDDRYEVIAFLKNAFDTIQHNVASEGQGMSGTRTTVGTNFVNVFDTAPPRTYGLEVRYKFF